MSEATPESTGTETGQADEGNTGTETEPEGTESTGTETTDSAAELAHWRDMARKNETRARENAKAAKELAELKRQGMSDLEKAQAEAAEAKRERDEARADHARVMAAATHDLPVELIDYLGSGTDDEINERAEVIAGAIETRAQEIAEARAGEPAPGRNGQQGARPVESLRAGSAPSGGSEPKTSEDWFRTLYTRLAAGVTALARKGI
jgi:hypothetical protein